MESLNDKVKIVNDTKNVLEDYSDNIVIKSKPTEMLKEERFELEIQDACISKIS